MPYDYYRSFHRPLILKCVPYFETGPLRKHFDAHANILICKSLIENRVQLTPYICMHNAYAYVIRIVHFGTDKGRKVFSRI